MKSKLLVISQNQGESYPAYFKRLQEKIESLDTQVMVIPVTVGTIIHSYLQWVEEKPETEAYPDFKY